MEYCEWWLLWCCDCCLDKEVDGDVKVDYSTDNYKYIPTTKIVVSDQILELNTQASGELQSHSQIQEPKYPSVESNSKQPLFLGDKTISFMPFGGESSGTPLDITSDNHMITKETARMLNELKVMTNMADKQYLSMKEIHGMESYSASMVEESTLNFMDMDGTLLPKSIKRITCQLGKNMDDIFGRTSESFSSGPDPYEDFKSVTVQPNLLDNLLEEVDHVKHFHHHDVENLSDGILGNPSESFSSGLDSYEQFKSVTVQPNLLDNLLEKVDHVKHFHHHDVEDLSELIAPGTMKSHEIPTMEHFQSVKAQPNLLGNFIEEVDHVKHFHHYDVEDPSELIAPGTMKSFEIPTIPTHDLEIVDGQSFESNMSSAELKTHLNISNDFAQLIATDDEFGPTVSAILENSFRLDEKTL